MGLVSRSLPHDKPCTSCLSQRCFEREQVKQKLESGCTDLTGSLSWNCIGRILMLVVGPRCRSDSQIATAGALSPSGNLGIPPWVATWGNGLRVTCTVLARCTMRGVVIGKLGIHHRLEIFFPKGSCKISDAMMPVGTQVGHLGATFVGPV